MEHNRYPGEDVNQTFDSDILFLKKYITKLCSDYSINVTIKDDYLNEM
jgi:hypothetical protein